MRKYIAGFVLLASLYPGIAFASINPGVEFLSPLVQTIIQLLQERIGVLNAENEALKAKLAQVPLCGAPIVQTTTQQRADVINKLEEQRIRGEFTAKILAVEEKMRDLQIKIDNPSVFECGGYGCPARSQLLQAAKDEVQNLDLQKRYLEIELKRQLASVGVF